MRFVRVDVKKFCASDPQLIKQLRPPIFSDGTAMAPEDHPATAEALVEKLSGAAQPFLIAPPTDQRGDVLIVNEQGTGDAILLTGALRDLHAAHPGRFRTAVQFRPRDMPLLENIPWVTPRERLHKPKTIRIAIWGDHETGAQSFQGAWNLELGRLLGVTIPLTRLGGDIRLSAEEMRAPSPAMELAGYAGKYWLITFTGWINECETKNWDPLYAQRLTELLDGRVKLIHIGSVRGTPPIPGAIGLLHRTNIRQLMRLLYHAEGLITYVGGVMVLASAVPTRPGAPASRPIIVLSGGRESPHLHATRSTTVLHTIGQLPCCAAGGCYTYKTEGWRPDCKLPERGGMGMMLAKCMRMITPEMVAEKVLKIQEGLDLYTPPAPAPEQLRIKREPPPPPFAVRGRLYNTDRATGVLHQIDARPIKYDETYNSTGSRTTEAMAYLRLGLISSAVGAEQLKRMSALELGPGNGVMFEVLRRHLASVDGIDAAPSRFSTITTEQARERRFGLLVACDVLEHFHEIDELWSYSFDYAYLSVPLLPPRELMENWRHLKPDEHLWHFSDTTLRAWMMAHGCNVIYSGSPEDSIRERWSEDHPNILTVIVQRPEVVQFKTIPASSGSASAIPARCAHLGEFLEEVDCPTCTNIRGKVFRCRAGLGRCSTFNRQLPEVIKCGPECSRYLPAKV